MHLGGPVLLGLAEVGLAPAAAGPAPDAGQGMATRAALLLTLALGGLCLHDPALASGLAVAVAILLAARSRLHASCARC